MSPVSEAEREKLVYPSERVMFHTDTDTNVIPNNFTFAPKP